jgi:HlyD family secretion protein
MFINFQRLLTQSITMKGNKLIYWLLGAVIVGGTLIFFGGKSKPKGDKVQTEKVTRRTINETVSASGKVFPEVEVKISSDVSGEIVELLVREGDTIKKGQLLCRINPEAYLSTVERGEAGVNSAKSQAAQSQVQVESARFRRDQAKAQLENTRNTFNRQKNLLSEGLISSAELENAAANLKVSEATLAAAEAEINSIIEGGKSANFNIQSANASLKELRTNLKRASIYAPKSGIISRLNVKLGERVLGTIQMSGTEILRIADFSSMEVQVDVSENDIPKINVNDDVDIDIDAFSGRKFKGKVHQIANTASNITSASGVVTLNSEQVTNFIVKIRIDPTSYSDLIQKGKKHPFSPGMSASVDITTKKVENILSLPIQAVTTRDRVEVKKDDDEGGRPKMQKVETPEEDKDVREVVFVCIGDTLAMKEVKIGIQDDKFIEVQGLQEGDEVVTGPYDLVTRKLKQGGRFIREDLSKKKDKEEKE